jgi:translation initiation factor IF-1
MSKQDCIKMTGTVVQDKSNSIFDVELDNGMTITATLSGKIRMNNIRILVGDKVDVELSMYDLTRGRITFRHKN